jgi:hypothetical protein
MAGVCGFELAQELQSELHWPPAFARAAKHQYLRYLELKTWAKDLRSAALAPSATIALVWNVHRQWSLDYMATCDGLGGYVHHFPSAMRDLAARQAAYARTRHMYTILFGVDPPALCWEPFGALSNAAAAIADAEADDVASPAGAAAGGGSSNPHANGSGGANGNGSANTNGNGNIDAPAWRPDPPASWDFPAPRTANDDPASSHFLAPPHQHTHNATAVMHVPQPGGSPDPCQRLPPAAASTPPVPGSAVPSNQNSQPSKSPVSKTPKDKNKPAEATAVSRAAKLAQGLVLRPPGKGEKRGRGRPKTSDYVLLDNLSLEERTEAIRLTHALIAASGDPQAHAVVAAAAANASVNTGSSGIALLPIAPIQKRGRGRPCKDGSWPTPKADRIAAMAIPGPASSPTGDGPPPKRKRGRPPGSTNKKKFLASAAASNSTPTAAATSSPAAGSTPAANSCPTTAMYTVGTMTVPGVSLSDRLSPRHGHPQPHTLPPMPHQAINAQLHQDVTHGQLESNQPQHMQPLNASQHQQQ